MKTPPYHQGGYDHPPSSEREADRVKNNPVCFTVDQVWVIIDGAGDTGTQGKAQEGTQ